MTTFCSFSNIQVLLLKWNQQQGLIWNFPKFSAVSWMFFDGYSSRLFSVPISRQVTTVRKWRRMREPPKNRALITIRFRMRRRRRNRKKSSHELGPKRGEKKKCGGGFLDERIYLEHSHLIKRQTIWLPAAPTAIQTNIISNSNDHSIISRMSSFFRENEVAFMYLVQYILYVPYISSIF